MEISSSNQFEFSTVNLLFVLGSADWCMEENISFKVDSFCPTEPNSCWEPKTLAPWKIQLCICTYIYIWYMYINIYTIWSQYVCVCVRVYPHGRGSPSTIHNQPQADHLFRHCRNIHLQYLTKMVDKFPNIAHISGYFVLPFSKLQTTARCSTIVKIAGRSSTWAQKDCTRTKKTGHQFASCQSQIT